MTQSPEIHPKSQGGIDITGPGFSIDGRNDFKMHELLFQDVCFHISWWLISSIKKGSYQSKVNSSISPSGKHRANHRVNHNGCITMHSLIHSTSATFFRIIHIQFHPGLMNHLPISWVNHLHIYNYIYIFTDV